MTILFVIAILLKLTLSNPNCPYFFTGGTNGPLIPINVCKQFQVSDSSGDLIFGSYKYRCNSLLGGLRAFYYLNSANCNSDADYTWVSDPLSYDYNCAPGVCEHVTFRSYARWQGRDNVCKRDQDDKTFIEYSLVSGCWSSAIYPSHSAYVHYTMIHKQT